MAGTATTCSPAPPVPIQAVANIPGFSRPPALGRTMRTGTVREWASTSRPTQIHRPPELLPRQGRQGDLGRRARAAPGRRRAPAPARPARGATGRRCGTAAGRDRPSGPGPPCAPAPCRRSARAGRSRTGPAAPPAPPRPGRRPPPPRPASSASASASVGLGPLQLAARDDPLRGEPALALERSCGPAPPGRGRRSAARAPAPAPRSAARPAPGRAARTAPARPPAGPPARRSARPPRRRPPRPPSARPGRSPPRPPGRSSAGKVVSFRSRSTSASTASIPSPAAPGVPLRRRARRVSPAAGVSSVRVLLRLDALHPAARRASGRSRTDPDHPRSSSSLHCRAPAAVSSSKRVSAASRRRSR